MTSTRFLAVWVNWVHLGFRCCLPLKPVWGHFGFQQRRLSVADIWVRMWDRGVLLVAAGLGSS